MPLRCVVVRGYATFAKKDDQGVPLISNVGQRCSQLSGGGLCDRCRGGQTDRLGGGQTDRPEGGWTDRSEGDQTDRFWGGQTACIPVVPPQEAEDK